MSAETMASMALRIACPFCKAPIGEPCASKSGTLTRFSHWRRFEAAKARVYLARRQAAEGQRNQR